ncbi:MAG: hypothetical protein Ct9H90mP9_1690 [Pseudomonadota bacterium]|nr:MAG: hypothetical protein Ct9H90mP9_1690 [Pseudomonadota bacterium]
MFRGLNQIWLQGILEDHAKGSDAIEFSCKNRFPGTVVTDHNPSKPLPRFSISWAKAMIVITSEAATISKPVEGGKSIKFWENPILLHNFSIDGPDIKGSAPGHTTRGRGSSGFFKMHRIVHHPASRL